MLHCSLVPMAAAPSWFWQNLHVDYKSLTHSLVWNSMMIETLVFLCRVQGHSQHPGIITLSISSPFSEVGQSLAGRLHSEVAAWLLRRATAVPMTRSRMRIDLEFCLWEYCITADVANHKHGVWLSTRLYVIHVMHYYVWKEHICVNSHN